MTLHLADTYYLPSWQGGDVKRPLCYRGRPGHAPIRLTESLAETTCPACAKARGFVLAPTHPWRNARPPTPTCDVIWLPDHSPTMMEIATRVAAMYALVLADLRDTKRKHWIAAVRQHAMWEMHERGFSNRQIAGFLGLEDHSTVVHGRRRHEARIASGERAAA